MNTETEKTITSRLEALRQQAEAQPLTWNPIKGESLIGTVVSYGREDHSRTFMIVRTQENCTHRVSLDDERLSQLTKANAGAGDLVLFQFLGKERNKYGQWRELAYKTITIDGDKKPDTLLKTFKRTREKLADSGIIVVHGDYAWRKYDEFSRR